MKAKTGKKLSHAVAAALRAPDKREIGEIDLEKGKEKDQTHGYKLFLTVAFLLKKISELGRIPTIECTFDFKWLLHWEHA